ncbi:phosphotriesterase-related protein-like isoform X2 [Limulus polyphemus]|uniref:Phosphotriesterase-related protein n=1 Tax=Limulus polyphemus TaxID=6850 RepID=A0ABM1BJD5_LIMPO|nr:phosphotriesterase-related protein-like isoform X2 [Limulus polyphemus]
MEAPRGKVQTVLGLVEPSALGCTLTHEHLSHCATGKPFQPTTPPGHEKYTDAPYTLENLGWIRQYPYSHKENIIFCGSDVQQAVLDDIKLFKLNGGGSIVENTTNGLNRDLNFMQKVSVETGVNIIAGAGYYVAGSQSTSTLDNSIEYFAGVMKRELLEGASGTTIRCGVIGELGCSWPLHDFEKRVLQAAGLVQSELKCPVIIHPGRDENAPEEILRIFTEAGGKADKIVMSHLDRTIFDRAKLLEFASMGSYCEFDLFGIEVSHYQMSSKVDMPSDAQRISFIHSLVEEGFEDKVVIAHDIHTKHRLKKYGGHGFSHILLSVVPTMLNRGISQTVIDKILIHNPAQWLAYNISY